MNHISLLSKPISLLLLIYYLFFTIKTLAQISVIHNHPIKVFFFFFICVIGKFSPQISSEVSHCPYKTYFYWNKKKKIDSSQTTGSSLQKAFHCFFLFPFSVCTLLLSLITYLYHKIFGQFLLFTFALAHPHGKKAFRHHDNINP